MARLLLAAAVVLATPAAALALDILPDPATDAATLTQTGYDLYLSVAINGISCDKVVPIHQEADSSLSIAPDDLANIGLLAPGPEALLPDARIALSRLPDITYVFDEVRQSIDFAAPDAAA